MVNYEYMQPSVDAICESLINEPHEWEFHLLHFNKKGERISYDTINIHHGRIPVTLYSYDRQEVFSQKQCYQIKEAYEIAREKQASVAQQEVINSLKAIRELENLKVEHNRLLKEFRDDKKKSL